MSDEQVAVVPPYTVERKDRSQTFSCFIIRRDDEHVGTLLIANTLPFEGVIAQACGHVFAEMEQRIREDRP